MTIRTALDTLADIRRRRDNYPTGEEIGAAIRAARAGGLTVTEIARQLGIQRQALYKRWPSDVA